MMRKTQPDEADEDTIELYVMRNENAEDIGTQIEMMDDTMTPNNNEDGASFSHNEEGHNIMGNIFQHQSS